MAGEGGQESAWDVLKGILPQLINALMRYAGTKSQTVFATATGLNANQVSRYRNGTQFPRTNLPSILEALGLVAGNGWWLLGHLLEKKYRRFKFDLSGQPGEVREPQATYDERGLDERLAAIMELDLSLLETYDKVRLTRTRNALKIVCEEAEVLRGSLETLLTDFEERYTDAVSRARSRHRG